VGMKEANSIKSFEIRWCWLNENEITASTACACGLLAGRALFSLEIMQRGTAFAFDEAAKQQTIAKTKTTVTLSRPSLDAMPSAMIIIVAQSYALFMQQSSEQRRKEKNRGTEQRGNRPHHRILDTKACSVF